MPLDTSILGWIYVAGAILAALWVIGEGVETIYSNPRRRDIWKEALPGLIVGTFFVGSGIFAVYFGLALFLHFVFGIGD